MMPLNLITARKNKIMNLNKLITEKQNTTSKNIDTVPTLEMIKLINKEDQTVALAVEKTLADIAKAVDLIVAQLQKGGRLIYIGAGTSGRLGILDASECPPTFGTDPNKIIGLIAGGKTAILKAVENAEDKPEQGKQDLIDIAFNQNDVLVGIAASGRTPYVLGAMDYAKRQKAKVISISCNPNTKMTKKAHVSITPIVGPEVITGSSRLKAGSAQKMILNMLSTGSMIKMGKVFGNLMVDVEATNEKLMNRQTSIVMQAADCNEKDAETALNACGRHCKTAILMVLTGKDALEAKTLLSEKNGFLRDAISDGVTGEN